MRFTFAESMCDPSHFLPLARAAEASGWDSFSIPDSICYPEVSDSKYPYTPDGNREFLEGKPFIEPFSLIPAMAAVTEKLRFATFVVKLPIRNPVLVAKQATSVACMSGNRFAFGVGLSPWPEDFAVCGEEWKGRGARMNEMIEIIRGLSTGDYFEFHGKYYDIQSIKLCPTPTEPLPILIGGAGPQTLRLVEAHADWWNCPLYALDRFDELRSSVGKVRASIQEMLAFVPEGADRTAVGQLAERRFAAMGFRLGEAGELRDHFADLGERGVERCYAWFSDFAPPETLAAFGREVIEPLHSGKRTRGHSA